MFQHGGHYSDLPFGSYTELLAQKLNCEPAEVDSLLLTEPRIRSSQYLPADHRTGAVNNDTGVLRIRIDGSNGLFLSDFHVDYTAVAGGTAHGETLTRFTEPDLLASINIGNSGVPIGIEEEEEKLRSVCKTRVLQEYLAGPRGILRINQAAEKTEDLSVAAKWIPPVLARRTAAEGGNNANRMVVAPYLSDGALVGAVFNNANNAVPDAAKLLANNLYTLEKTVPLGHMLANDFLLTGQLVPSFKDTIVSFRTNPLRPAVLCNALAPNGNNNGHVAHEDIAEDGRTLTANPASIVLRWSERTVRNPNMQTVLDEVIGTKDGYTFPGFTIKSESVDVLQGEAQATGHCAAGPGNIHWVMASMQPGGTGTLMPMNGQYLSTAVSSGLDLTMQNPRNVDSEEQREKAKRRYVWAQTLFKNEYISQTEFETSNILLFPLGLGMKTAGSNQYAKVYHPTRANEVEVRVRRGDAAAAGTLHVGLGQREDITLLNINSQAANLRTVVKF